jgi:ferrous iron transport protein A
LAIGSAGRVAKVFGSDDVSLRLMEMGVLPGASVRVLGAAPLGDPIEIEVRGSRLGLRRSEAERVELTVDGGV